MEFKPSRLEAAPALLLLVLLGGCQAVHVQVDAMRSRLLDLPAPHSTDSVAVEADTQPAGLLPRELNAKLTYLLEQRGYRVTNNLQDAHYLLHAYAAINRSEPEVFYETMFWPGHEAYGYAPSRSRVTTTIGFGYDGYPYYGYGAGLHYGPYERTVYCKWLALTLYDTRRLTQIERRQAAQNVPPQLEEPTTLEGENPPSPTPLRCRRQLADAIVWQSNAVNCNSDTDLRWYANALLLASFDHWGKDTPRQQHATIDSDSDRFQRLANVEEHVTRVRQ